MAVGRRLRAGGLLAGRARCGVFEVRGPGWRRSFLGGSPDEEQIGEYQPELGLRQQDQVPRRQRTWLWRSVRSIVNNHIRQSHIVTGDPGTKTKPT